MRRVLPKAHWKKLSEAHVFALEILRASPPAEFTKPVNSTFKHAMHDLWGFGFAERKLGPTRYRLTGLGQEACEFRRRSAA